LNICTRTLSFRIIIKPVTSNIEIVMSIPLIKKRVAFCLDDSSTVGGKGVDLLLLFLNLAACALFVINSDYKDKVPQAFELADIALVSVFSIEYLLRVWVAENRWKYVLSFYGLVDLISILPSLITLSELRFLRGLKVLRILRFLRFLENESFFFGKLSQLQLQAARTIFTVFTILFVSSGFILYFEAYNPQPLIRSFGDSFYFCVVTLSTVGFGDMTPITVGGKWATVVMILGGAILVPFQAGKLVKVLLNDTGARSKATCSSCGLIGHDADASHCKACGAIIYQEYQSEV